MFSFSFHIQGYINNLLIGALGVVLFGVAMHLRQNNNNNNIVD